MRWSSLMSNGDGPDLWKWMAAAATSVFTAGAASHIRVRDRVARLEEGHVELKAKANLQQETRDDVTRLIVKVGSIEEDVREGAMRLEKDMSKQVKSVERIEKSLDGLVKAMFDQRRGGG
jgi:hypothetical protein